MTEQERYMTTTPFLTIYNRFLSKVTDDMYIAWTEADTHADLKNMLLAAIPKFEFPKFKLFDYDPDVDITENSTVVSQGRFNFGLTQEEIEIFADLLMVEWMRRQIATVDNTRMKYSSDDFKVSSQANHMDKLLKVKSDFEASNKHMQKVYGRRRYVDGYIKSNFAGLGGSNNGN